jgi:radical SAM protein with 4Fe4S-binding SPASM domain
LRNSPNAYKHVNRALTLLGKSILKYKDAVTCVYPANLVELDTIAQILHEKGINSWRLFRIFPSGRAKENENIKLSFAQTQQLIDWIAQNKKKWKKKGLDINLSCEGFLPFDEDVNVRNHAFFCRAGINIASILSNGDITGCSNNHSTFKEGNILTDNFVQLWEHGFQKFRKKEWLKETICVDCEYFNKCQGASIHLWELPHKSPKFCYTKDLSNENN